MPLGLLICSNGGSIITLDLFQWRFHHHPLTREVNQFPALLLLNSRDSEPCKIRVSLTEM